MSLVNKCFHFLDKYLSWPHSMIFVLRRMINYILTVSNAYLATSRPINSNQTLSISTVSCQIREARRTAPAPAVKLMGVILSLSLQFASPVTSGFVFPVRPTASKVIYSDDNSCLVFAGFAMSITSLDKKDTFLSDYYCRHAHAALSTGMGAF